MPIAAVPDYIGEDFGQAPPGHRFYLYFRVWGVDQDTQTPCWGTSEQRNGRNTTNNKRAALEAALRLTDNDKKTSAALVARQNAVAEACGALSLPAKSMAPLATGLGMEHPLENGFAFLNPYGLPYLPGSGIKGVLRAAARELCEAEVEGWSAEVIEALFGPKTDDEARRGALVFWDALPDLGLCDALAMEVMTPHQSHYLQASEPPHDNGQPNPILFAAVPPDTKWTFHVICNRALLPAALAEDDAWRGLLEAAFEHAFEWLGFGAKTAVGYGHTELDRQALAQQDEARAEREEEHRRQQELAAQTRDLPDDAAKLVRLQSETTDWSNNGAFLDAMEGWLGARTEDTLTAKAWLIVAQNMQSHFEGDILADPDARKGKKQKLKYSDRQRALAKRLLDLKPTEAG